MSGAKGAALTRYTEYDIEELTHAQVGRLASHIEEHVSDRADRIDAAEALGLRGYVGHDTAKMGQQAQGRPVWRDPTPVNGESREALLEAAGRAWVNDAGAA
jgi:hypothetical protein